MSLHTQYWFSPDSTHRVLAMLAEGSPVRLGSDLEELVLRRLVDTRDCPICTSEAGQLCQVYGGMSTLMRTHPLRLHTTRAERVALVNWAMRKAGRREPACEIAAEPDEGAFQQ